MYIGRLSSPWHWLKLVMTACRDLDAVPVPSIGNRFPAPNSISSSRTKPTPSEFIASDCFLQYSNDPRVVDRKTDEIMRDNGLIFHGHLLGLRNDMILSVVRHRISNYDKILLTKITFWRCHYDFEMLNGWEDLDDIINFSWWANYGLSVEMH